MRKIKVTLNWTLADMLGLSPETLSETLISLLVTALLGSLFKLLFDVGIVAVSVGTGVILIIIFLLYLNKLRMRLEKAEYRAAQAEEEIRRAEDHISRVEYKLYLFQQKYLKFLNDFGSDKHALEEGEKIALPEGEESRQEGQDHS